MSKKQWQLPEKEWRTWMIAKRDAARVVINSRIRIDEQALKRQKLDTLPKLLEEIRKAKEANPALLTVGHLLK